ncbi:hypothetical protein, partial [Bradyrhizobium sp. 62]|uniref:hypothetical protein n=1 Tax=Bradyrhizobium sp. 62 TaxID=1043588 RepID=UPI001FF87B2B
MTEPRDQSSAEICDAATLADKIAAWSPSSRCPLVFIARERRLIEDALRTFSVAQPLNQQAKDHPPLDNPRDPFASPDRITGGAQPARDLSSDQIMEILRRTVQGELLALLTVGRRQGLGADVRIPSMSAEVLAREFIAAAQSAPALTASHNSGERAPSSDAARAGAGTQCSAATEDEMGVIESDRLFAEQIIADFGSFEEGITDQEKLAQWIRNIRRACSTPDEPQSSGWQPIETAPKDGT